MDDIVPAVPGSIQAVAQEADAAHDYAAASRAASTRLIYDADWRRFQTWCAARGVPPLPADPVAVARFCAGEAEAGRAPSTITRRLATIGWAHKRAGHTPPQRADGSGAIAEVMAGIRRSRAAPPEQKAAADADVLRDMLRAVRARAVLAMGVRRRIPALGIGRPPCRGYPHARGRLPPCNTGILNKFDAIYTAIRSTITISHGRSRFTHRTSSIRRTLSSTSWIAGASRTIRNGGPLS